MFAFSRAVGTARGSGIDADEAALEFVACLVSSAMAHHAQQDSMKSWSESSSETCHVSDTLHRSGVELLTPTRRARFIRVGRSRWTIYGRSLLTCLTRLGLYGLCQAPQALRPAWTLELDPSHSLNVLWQCFFYDLLTSTDKTDVVPKIPSKHHQMPSRKPDRSYGRNFRFAKSSYNPQRTKTIDASSLRASEATNHDEKIQATRLANTIDESMGFARYESGKKKIGWLCNMHSTSIEDEKIPGGRAGVDYYFIEEDGGTFKATVEHDPYFLIAVKKSREAEVEEWCRRKFEGLVKSVKRIEKEDLQMPNHLLGYRRMFLHLSFENVGDLLAVRKALMPIAEKNKNNMNVMDTYAEVAR